MCLYLERLISTIDTCHSSFLNKWSEASTRVGKIGRRHLLERKFHPNSSLDNLKSFSGRLPSTEDMWGPYDAGQNCQLSKEYGLS